jgi:hypothetical protein
MQTIKTALSERQRYSATPPDDLSERLVLAEEGVDLIDDVPSAREVVERVVAECLAGQCRDRSGGAGLRSSRQRKDKTTF